MTVFDIRIEAEDFSLDQEYTRLRSHSAAVGAIATFTGLVRELSAQETDEAPVTLLELEHYPGMTEKSIQAIADEAAGRWSLLGLTIIHRVGALRPTDQIVFVGAASAHRSDAFAAAQFVMDYLKTRAVLWKKEHRSQAAHWVESSGSDHSAAQAWSGEAP